MARSSKRLSAVDVRNKNKPGRYADGDGLYLNIAEGGTKSWAFLWMKAGRRREMGIGSFPTLSLSGAREKVEGLRRIVAAGGDPIAERKRETSKTFGEAADAFVDSMEAGWRNAKHVAQWRMTLGDAYCGSIRSDPVSDIDTEAVLKVLTPIWQKRPETASRLRGRIERVLDFAKLKGWRDGENPALWRGHLKNALPPRRKLAKGHHAAMPYSDIPAFVARLRALPGTSARALELLILTAARSGEVLGATWPEFNLKTKVWILPAERMKMGVEHRVPLSDRAVAILQHLKGDADASGFVFPGEREGRPLSNMALTMLMRRMKVGQFTAHGFRSAFRDWVGDETSFPREIAEAALAHRVGDETERAYRRSDALERRRKMMDAWAAFCSGSSNVAQLRPADVA